MIAAATRCGALGIARKISSVRQVAGALRCHMLTDMRANGMPLTGAQDEKQVLILLLPTGVGAWIRVLRQGDAAVAIRSGRRKGPRIARKGCTDSLTG